MLIESNVVNNFHCIQANFKKIATPRPDAVSVTILIDLTTLTFNILTSK